MKYATALRVIFGGSLVVSGALVMGSAYLLGMGDLLIFNQIDSVLSPSFLIFLGGLALMGLGAVIQP